MDCNCGSLAEAADHDGGANAGAGRHVGEGFVDLDGEFARGGQDRRRGCRRWRLLARARWIRGRTNASVLPVPVCAVATRSRAGQRRLDGQGLDGGGLGKAVLCEIALQESREREFRETFHLVVFEEENRRADYR